MSNKLCPLQSGAIYHVYNRANGSEKLFLTEENYRYFLRRFTHFISPIAHLRCYCLMPNHFHFIIEIKSEEEIKKYFLNLPGLEDLADLKNISKLISLQFSHFFNSYSKALNKQIGRKGSLFMKPFKRKEITDEKYLFNLIRYIHLNPVEAGLCLQPEHWQHSSYQCVLTNNSTLVDVNNLVNWFGDLKSFYEHHEFLLAFEIAS